jgi:hypothetical protein
LPKHDISPAKRLTWKKAASAAKKKLLPPKDQRQERRMQNLSGTGIRWFPNISSLFEITFLYNFLLNPKKSDTSMTAVIEEIGDEIGDAGKKHKFLLKKLMFLTSVP